MSNDEIPRFGSGERGEWVIEPIDAPDPETAPAKINTAMLEGDGIRGIWRYDKALKAKGENPFVHYVPLPKKHVHNIITDELPKPLMYMGNNKGEMFTSRSKLLRRTKEDGFEIVGHERPTELKRDLRKEREERAEDVRRAMADNRNGNAQLSEMEKEKCLREKREFEAYKRRQKTVWAH